MTRLLAIAAILLLAFGLAGCGGGKNKEVRADPLAVPDTALGPDTGDVLKKKPKGLPGDKENARYTNETLHGEDDGGD